MRYFVFGLVVVTAMFAFEFKATAADCEWVEARKKNPIMLQNKGFLQYWVGKLLAVCVEAGKEPDGYSPALIQITHITDRSPYGCGQPVQVLLGKTDDATATGWATKACELRERPN